MATDPINSLLPTAQQNQDFMALDWDGPIVMVNLLKFKSDGGAKQYAQYSAGVAPLLEQVGARLLFSGAAKHCWIGNADWDSVALVEYPSKEALLEMIGLPEYKAIHHHREAGLEGQVNYAVAQK